MPAKIRVLSDSVINQIAAGEIIENPASLIKELVENSLDAGSSKIQIDVHGGGHLFIQVIDDGCGMGRDDAILCFERHATSKISQFADLSSLISMGFRGEALASIGAVSKLELETAEDGTIQTIGTKVICNGGKILRADPFSRNPGTTIRVSDLFYNVPARKKFQKSASQSTADIVKMLTRVSLAHREVSFTLNSNGKELLSTSHKSEKRIEEVLGKEFLNETKEISWEKEGYKIHGVIGSPLNVRSNRLQEYLLINKRPVVSHLVERAIQSGFGTRIGSKDYPVFVLWMEVPPDRLDVNVHPQKIFVRFCEEEKMHHFVKTAIEESFYVEPQKIVLPKFAIEPVTPCFVEAKVEYQPSFELDKERLIQEEIEVIGFFEDVAMVKIPPPFFSEERLVFVDIAKLNSKVQFQRILGRLKGGRGGEMEALLFPEVLKFSKGEEEVIIKHEDLLNKIGIGIRPFGKETFMIEALSPLYSIDKVRKVIDQLLVEFHKEFSLESVVKIVVNFCPPKIVSKQELKHLLSEVLKMDEPFYAPNGKLIMASFNKEEFFGKK